MIDRACVHLFPRSLAQALSHHALAAVLGHAGV
jgi:hypothetical protein